MHVKCLARCLVHGSCPGPICHPSILSHQEGERYLKLLEGKATLPRSISGTFHPPKSGICHPWGFTPKGLLSRAASPGFPEPRAKPWASRRVAYPSEGALGSPDEFWGPRGACGSDQPSPCTLPSAILARCKGRLSSHRAADRLPCWALSSHGA